MPIYGNTVRLSNKLILGARCYWMLVGTMRVVSPFLEGYIVVLQYASRALLKTTDISLVWMVAT